MLELVMNGMRVAGLALSLEALSSFVLGGGHPCLLPPNSSITSSHVLASTGPDEQ